LPVHRHAAIRVQPALERSSFAGFDAH
jgi:hypothetical protein